MSSSPVIIGEAPNRELGEIIVAALSSEGILAHLVGEAGRGAPVEIATNAGDAELAKEILAFLKKEIAKQGRS